MKKSILLFSILWAFQSFSQDTTNYKLASAGEYVLGVYLFIHCEPVHPYEYVGKVRKFDVYSAGGKRLESIVRKARKVNPSFDALIVKRNFKHIELIKFADKRSIHAGFSMGQIVQFLNGKKLIAGEIVAFYPHKDEVAVRHYNKKNAEKISKVKMRHLNHIQ